MIGLGYLALIVGAVLAALWLIGMAGDQGARMHRERDPFGRAQR